MTVADRLNELEVFRTSLETRIKNVERRLTILTEQLEELICMHHHTEHGTKNRLTVAAKSIKKFKKQVDKGTKSALLAVDIAHEAKWFSKAAAEAVQSVVNALVYEEDEYFVIDQVESNLYEDYCNEEEVIVMSSDEEVCKSQRS